MEHRPKLNKLVRTKMIVFNYTILSANEQLDSTMFVLLFFRSFTDKIFNSYASISQSSKLK